MLAGSEKSNVQGLTGSFRLDYWENWVWFQELERESKPEYIYFWELDPAFHFFRELEPIF
jgi:hypothetical protein